MTRAEARAFCKALLREARRTDRSPRFHPDTEEFVRFITENEASFNMGRSLIPYPKHFGLDRSEREVAGALAAVELAGFLDQRSATVLDAIRGKCASGAQPISIDQVRDFLQAEVLRYRVMVDRSKNLPRKRKRLMRKSQLGALATATEGYVLIFEQGDSTESERLTVSQRLLQD